MKLAERWGKEPSLIRKDIRGFITNRLMYAMMREAFHLVENEYATYEDIDRACRNDFGYWINVCRAIQVYGYHWNSGLFKRDERSFS